MFGKPAFGSPAPNTSFGFGASTSTANPFGQTQNLFNKPATGGFGSSTTSTFGQPASTSLFPATQSNTTNLFQNANTTFGAAPSTQPGFGTTNLFGQPQQTAPGGLFNTSSTFGQQPKPTGFGFGTPQTQPSLFGQQPQQQPSLFQSSGTSLFGGSTAFGAQQSGTVVKFNPMTGTDTMMKNGVTQSINTKHHSITCMKEYENKSFEELRFEDYQANRKGPQQQAGFGAAAPFGAPASSAPSLFGQTDANKPAFGQTTGFGASTTSTFGQTTPGFGLGAQQTTSGGLFGSKPTAFGAPTSSTATGFGFGATPQNANPFGAAQPAKPFGATPSLFGTPSTQPSTGFGGGLFGQTSAQNTGTGLFNKPAQTSTGFGAPAAQNTGFSFNTPASTQSTSLFGNTKPLFGQTTSTTAGFGTTNTFGTTQPGFGSSFGQKPAAPGFGTTQTTGFGTTFGGGLQNQSTSLFGNTQNKPGGLFGTTSTTTGGTGLFSTGGSFQSGVGFGLGTQQPQQQSLFPQQDQMNSSNIALLTSDPFGDAPHLAGLEPKLKSDSNQAISATDPKELKSLLDSSKKVEMHHGSKLKVVPLKNVRDSLFEGVDFVDSSSKSPLNAYTKNSCRRLILKAKKPNEGSPSILRTDILDILDSENKENSSEKNGSGKKIVGTEIRTNPVRLSFDLTGGNDSLHNSIELHGQTHSSTTVGNISLDDNKKSTPQPSDDEETVENPSSVDRQSKTHPANITCTRPEYYTLPNLDTLAQYVDENGHCVVKGFTIGRKGYGNVYFPEEMDVSGLNIDQLVHFRYREINVYPDESRKPPEGQGLNRRAQVTLDNVYPRKTGSNTLVRDVSELVQLNFAEKLRKITEKKGARFVDYRPETGSWVFKVDHFSKYGFNDSDEENEENATKNEKKTESRKEIGALKGKTEENREKIEKQSKQTEKVALVQEKEQESSKFGLDKDILIEEDDVSSEDDLLHQSMYLDHINDDDYRQIPTEMPLDIAYDSYKTAKSIQVMKSTLFAEEDRSSDDAASHVSIIKQYLDIPDEIPRLPMLREEVATKRRPIERPKVYKVCNFGGSDSSIEILPSRCCLDLTLFKGKSFKSGWSKGFNFYALNTKHSELSLETFDKQPKSDPLQQILIESLRNVLHESTYELNSQKIPTFRINKGLSYLERQTRLFEKLADRVSSKESCYLQSIWTLCTALWGSGEDTIANRRYLLSEWLKSNTTSDDLTLKTSSFSSPTEVIQSIFSHLTVFKTKEAASIAMDNRFPHLSLLIAQLSLTNITKSFIQEQIDNWYASMASNHISEATKSVYLLLSGIPNRDEVNIFADVDWKRALAMHLWYVCPQGAPIEAAIDSYEKAFELAGYAEKPNPPYIEGYVEDGPFDVLYHILKMYKTRIHRLSSLLNPATHTDDPLDYRMGFLLLQLFISLNVGLIDTAELNKFYTSFSNQLEHLGHYEWAIFVLLHLEDDTLKKNLITAILDRNLDTDAKQTSDVLVNDMRLPPEWIHNVKAEKHELDANYYEAFNHYALAKQYVKANEIFVDRLLPDLFVNEQFEAIRTLIGKLEVGSREILRWRNEAGLLSDFLRLQEDVLSFKPEVLTRLQMQMGSLSDRLAGFPAKTDQQKLCVAEMSKRLVSLYRELCEKSNESIFKESYTQFVESLIMPPDFKQNEGLFLINYFYDFKLYRQ